MGKWASWGKAGRRGSRLVAIAMGLAVSAAGMLGSTSAVAGIADTKHNLGTSGAAGQNQFSATAEICVFCHTPHGADTSAAVPLWNRTLPAAGSFTTYDSLGTSTLDGKTAVVGSVSIACLSCHDGVTSMSAVINAPGSGTTNATWTAGTWSGPNVTAGTAAAGGGKIAGGITLIGTDLRNDHPIGIQYAGGGFFAIGQNGAAAGTKTDPDFKDPTTAVIGSTRVWWVDTTGGTANRDKTDMILYTRPSTDLKTPGTAGNYEPFVECASCHDPHTSTAPTFLRIANTGSAVCLACHVK